MTAPREQQRSLTLDPSDNLEAVWALSAAASGADPDLLHRQGPMNVNRISEILAIAQSTVAIDIHVRKPRRWSTPNW